MENKKLLSIFIVLVLTVLSLGMLIYIQYMNKTITIENKGDVTLIYNKSADFDNYLSNLGLWEKDNVTLPNNPGKKYTINKIRITVTKTPQRYYSTIDSKLGNKQIFSIGAQVENDTLILPLYINSESKNFNRQQQNFQVLTAVSGMLYVVTNDGQFPDEKAFQTKSKQENRSSYPNPFSIK